MLMLAATAQPDYIAIALVAAIFAIVVVMVIRKRFGAPKAAQAETVEIQETAPEISAPTAPGSAGQLKIYDVPPKTAAMLMAIVANKMDKPLNELRFISIKEVK